jgi:hypothetical protein
MPSGHVSVQAHSYQKLILVAINSNSWWSFFFMRIIIHLLACEFLMSVLLNGLCRLAAFACFKALVDHELYTIQF